MKILPGPAQKDKSYRISTCTAAGGRGDSLQCNDGRLYSDKNNCIWSVALSTNQSTELPHLTSA